MILGTREAMYFDTLVKVYMEESKTMLISKEEYEKELEELEQAVVDRRILAEGIEERGNWN